MIELLALPGWQAPPVTLEDWSSRLRESGSDVIVTRESTGVSWLECTRHRFRGYAVMAGRDVEAINFELNALDPEPAARVIEAVALALGWEVHAEDPDEESDSDEDDDD